LAIIVDKEQKKKDIALSTKELLLNNGINNITISQIAKNASIGKGTIYEYFSNKNEIVFELVNILMQQYNEAKEKKLLDVASTKEKIKVLMDFFYDDAYFDIRVLYKDFTAITLMNNNESMVTFQTERFKFYTDWIDDIIQEGIDKQELIPHAKELVMGLFAYSQGIFIMSVTSNAIESLKDEMNTHIDTLFTLMEVKS
jgi:AcrR family transcriptional regulator